MSRAHKPYNGFKAFLVLNSLTLEDLSKKLNIKRNTLASKINGQSDFSITETEIICKLFNIKPSMFF